MITERNRQLINKIKLEREEKCCNCGITTDIQWHHIVPLALGGNDIETNIVPICIKCHALIHNKKRMSNSNLIKEGIKKAKAEGKQIGNEKGVKLTTKKSIIAKEIIFKNSKDFNGSLNDEEVIKLAEISRKTYYKYKKELREEGIIINE